MSFFEERWWVFVLRGVLAIFFGLLCFMMPGISLLVLTTLVAAYWVVDGVSALAAIGRTKRAGGSWGWLLFEGLLGLAAGIGAFVYPGMTALILLFFIGVWSIAIGLSRIMAAVQLRKLIRDEWLLVLSGLLAIAFGAIVLARPGPGALAVIWTIGLYGVVFGALLVGVGIRIHSLTGRRAEPPMTPA